MTYDYEEPNEMWRKRLSCR